jgi:hypothetical protein
MMIKKCTKCLSVKNINNFQKKGENYFSSRCKLCINEMLRNKYNTMTIADKNQLLTKNKKYRNTNKNKISLNKKHYYSKNKDKILCYKDQYRKINKLKLREISKKFRLKNRIKICLSNRKYYRLNSDKYRIYSNIYMKRRLLEDPAFKIRHSLSQIISYNLRKRKSNKYGFSILKYLSYTIQELKEHLEKQFESWMTWENRGRYTVKSWNDDDASTWTWNIDHIIPQSKLPYTNMEDDNFKQCWALENLRPLSAKQNILEENRR